MLMHEHDCLLDNEKHIVETISHSVIRRGFKFLRNFPKRRVQNFPLNKERAGKIGFVLIMGGITN